MEIALILILIVLNGVFAMAEIAILSAKKSRLQKLANEDDKNAQTALELAQHPNKLLSTVQIGITLIGILAGAYGGSTVADSLAVEFAKVPAIASYSAQLAFVLVVGIITFLSLIIGEIVPKRLALLNPERIAIKIARPMGVLSSFASPLVFILSASTDFVLRFFPIPKSKESQVSDEEVKLLLREGTQIGVFESAEQDIVERTLKLSDKRVNALMSPRAEIDWIVLDSSITAIRKKVTASAHSHYPVCRDSLDSVVGIVKTSDVLTDYLEDGKIDLKKSLHKPVFVPESMPALKLLELFKKSGIHMALVIDEYGSIKGLVSLTDVLEEIVGDIPDIDDLDEQEITKHDENSWLVNGVLPIEEFKEYFHIRKLPSEKTGVYHTIGGFVMNRLGKIPLTGDKTEWNEYTFEVVDMDGNRIDKILVTKTS
jgi:putative hemolysin